MSHLRNLIAVASVALLATTACSTEAEAEGVTTSNPQETENAETQELEGAAEFKKVQDGLTEGQIGLGPELAEVADSIGFVRTDEAREEAGSHWELGRPATEAEMWAADIDSRYEYSVSVRAHDFGIDDIEEKAEELTSHADELVRFLADTEYIPSDMDDRYGPGRESQVEIHTRGQEDEIIAAHHTQGEFKPAELLPDYGALRDYYGLDSEDA